MRPVALDERLLGKVHVRAVVVHGAAPARDAVLAKVAEGVLGDFGSFVLFRVVAVSSGSRAGDAHRH